MHKSHVLDSHSVAHNRAMEFSLLSYEDQASGYIKHESLNVVP